MSDDHDERELVGTDEGIEVPPDNEDHPDFGEPKDLPDPDRRDDHAQPRSPQPPPSINHHNAPHHSQADSDTRHEPSLSQTHPDRHDDLLPPQNPTVTPVDANRRDPPHGMPPKKCKQQPPQEEVKLMEHPSVLPASRINQKTENSSPQPEMVKHDDEHTDDLSLTDTDAARPHRLSDVSENSTVVKSQTEKAGGESDVANNGEQNDANTVTDTEGNGERVLTDSEIDNIGRDESNMSDPQMQADLKFITESKPTTRLENVLYSVLRGKDIQIRRLRCEIDKLKLFISKRKQTYKRKRKDESAPTRPLSAYNIFVQDRFKRLKKENEAALVSEDAGVVLKRVPPANLVAASGNEWRDMSPEEKAKYEERAKADRKRYEEQMVGYQPPEKQVNRKRNKTGYNMFFSAHVLRLKQSDQGVPSERGSVARLVGTAWKQLTPEEKQYYEREADKHNGMHPIVDKDEPEDDEEEEEPKRLHVPQQQPPQPPPPPTEHYGHMPPPHDMHMHGGMPPPPTHHPAHHHGHHQPPQHDPRHHGYAYPPQHMYGHNQGHAHSHPHGYYDYGPHHGQHTHQRHGRPSQYSQPYGGQQRHGYDGM